MSSTPVRVSSALYAELNYFSQVTGVPIKKCIQEAIDNWLECIAPDRLDAALSQTEIRQC